MLKRDDWYDFIIPADHTTVLKVNYLITGVNPDAVEFHIE